MKTKLVLVAAAASTALAIAAPEANREMPAVLDELGTLGGKPIATLSPEEARKQPSLADAVKSLLKKRGASIAPVGKGPFSVIIYIHVGGWVITDLDTYDSSPRAFANACNAVVVSTNYRLAPEHPFPASHEDVFAAYSPSSIRENL